jgi:RNA polymerase sigma factor (sigma-70 family)
MKDILKEQLRHALERVLDDRSRRIVELRTAGYTFPQIAEELPLSRERIREIYRRALEKLRRSLTG